MISPLILLYTCPVMHLVRSGVRARRSIVDVVIMRIDGVAEISAVFRWSDTIHGGLERSICSSISPKLLTDPSFSFGILSSCSSLMLVEPPTSAAVLSLAIADFLRLGVGGSCFKIHGAGGHPSFNVSSLVDRAISLAKCPRGCVIGKPFWCPARCVP